MMIDDESTPRGDDVDDLEQEEPEGPMLVPVRLEGTARVRQLPRRHWFSRNWTLQPSASAVQVAGRDPRRAVLRLWIVDDGGAAVPGQVYVGASQAGAEDGTEAILSPAGFPLELTHVGEVWLYCSDPALTATVSVVGESWAD